MIQIDIAITKFVNSFAGQSHLFDRIVLEIFQMNTFKMLPLVTLMVWLWFSNDPQGMRRRFVFNGMAGGFIALVITRVVQNLGPHRPRPALSGEFEFVLPAGGYTNDWSSFPSDTTGLAFAMVLGIWFASRKLGVLALFWSIFIIAFPRLYGGFHYVSDLVAGALIGMASTYAFARIHAISDPLFEAMMRLAKDRKALFYALAFIVAYQTSTYFGDIRKTGEKALHSIGLK